MGGKKAICQVRGFQPAHLNETEHGAVVNYVRAFASLRTSSTLQATNPCRRESRHCSFCYTTSAALSGEISPDLAQFRLISALLTDSKHTRSHTCLSPLQPSSTRQVSMRQSVALLVLCALIVSGELQDDPLKRIVVESALFVEEEVNCSSHRVTAQDRQARREGGRSMGSSYLASSSARSPPHPSLHPPSVGTLAQKAGRASPLGEG